MKQKAERTGDVADIRNIERDYHYHMTFPVTGYDIDSHLRVELDRLLDYAQEVDRISGIRNGVTGEMLAEHGVSWILVGLKFVLDQAIPFTGEEMLLDSWVRGMRGVRFHRDNAWFKRTGDADDWALFGRATLDWILVSNQERTVFRPFQLLGKDEFERTFDPLPSFSEPIERLKPIVKSSEQAADASAESSSSSAVCVDRYQMRLSDIDLNHHVHNTYYIRDALNTLYAWLGLGSREQIELLQCDVNFNQETVIHETLEYWLQPLDTVPPAESRLAADGTKQNQAVLIEAYNPEKEETRCLIRFIYRQ